MVITRRMVNQRLWGTPFGGIDECVRELAAIQAQEFPYAKWSIGQRTGGVTESLVDKAFAEGALLRTHVLRPTWHFVTPGDIRWLIELTGPRVNAVTAHYYRQHGVDDELAAKSAKLFTKALKGGNHLTRAGMRQLLEKAGIELTNLRLVHILMRAELDLVICSGAPQGKQQTYALVGERAPHAVSRSRDEALVELVTRYFATRGPATLKDFAWWSGLTQADGQRGIDLAGSFERTVENGRTYWSLPQPIPRRPPSPRIDLVQIYDEIGMAYTESRDALLDGQARPAPDFYHSILLDGRLAGHWRRTVKGASIVFETQLFRPLEGAEAGALETAQQRYRTFSMDDSTVSDNGSVPGRKRAKT